MATRSENSDTESNETWNISGNEIRSEGSEVVFLENNNEVVRTILRTRRRGGTIKIANNKIISTGGGRVGICKIGKNYYNWGVLIFLLVLIFGLANWEKSTATQRLSNQQATVAFRQLPMSVDLNLGTRADLEDNNQYRDSENYLGEEEL
ncbi:hypothetical protein PRUPE_1G185100 [Prunus persica]|uniref:Uncharacterized protein n=1 Tax=Prunus persica TaxID=3760 RepID=A0A251QZB3_PRUPE|nr:uncharacterized protein LOC109946744 [Prunus persica]ONI29171.1 hypothetical protein PRUPE_1G185100 [Prunus persica]